jgi:hypothetical protein
MIPTSKFKVLLPLFPDAAIQVQNSRLHSKTCTEKPSASFVTDVLILNDSFRTRQIIPDFNPTWRTQMLQ